MRLGLGLKLGSDNIGVRTKVGWKYVLRQNELYSLKRIKSYKMLDNEIMKKEMFGMQPCMKTLRTRMTRTIQMNFRGDPVLKTNCWKCVSCCTSDTQEHVMICDGYKSLTKEKHLTEDNEVVIYFRKVIKLRS